MTSIDYTSSLSDPRGSSVLLAASGWLQGTLLGTMATTVAVITVAAIGMMMLAGRFEWRRGASVIIGCFILFGATSIAAGIQSAVNDGEVASAPPEVVIPIIPLPEKPRPAPNASPYDPYAGASVPSG